MGSAITRRDIPESKEKMALAVRDLCKLFMGFDFCVGSKVFPGNGDALDICQEDKVRLKCRGAFNFES